MTEIKAAGMIDVWHYFAGDSVTSVPAKLTKEQKDAYRIATFRTEWGVLSDTEKEWFKTEVGKLMAV